MNAYLKSKDLIDAGIAAEKKLWDAQVADAQSMIDTNSKKAISESEQVSADTTRQLHSQNVLADKMTLSPEGCTSSHGGYSSTAGQLEASKTAAIKGAARIARSNLMPSGNAQVAAATNQHVADYCDLASDPTDPLCQAAAAADVKMNPSQLDVGGTRAGRNMQASSLTSGAGNENINGERLSFSPDQMKAAQDYVNKIADGTDQPQALSPSQAKTAEGVRYEQQRGDYIARRSIAVGILDNEVSAKEPKSELYKKLKEMAAPSTTSGFVSKVVTDSLAQIDSGKGIRDKAGSKGVSADDMTRIEFTRRADSPEYLKMVNDIVEDLPLLKDIAFMNASSLKIQYMMYLQQQKSLMMQAQMVLDRVDASSLAQLKQMRAVAAANQ
jgi:hypothetical protein